MAHPRPSTSSTSSSVYSAVDHDREWLPALVAKYGSSTSTAWIETRYAVWRSPNHTQSNPRVQGYLPRGKFYFAWGPPICRRDPEIRKSVAHEFVDWVTKEKKRRVVYCVVDTDFAEMLGSEFNWSVLSCVREDVLHPDIKKLEQKEVRHNIRRAERSHVKYEEIKLRAPQYHPPDDVREEIEAGLERWKANRHGTQIAAAGLLPWLDAQHRRYFLARDEHKKIVAICVLAAIAHDSYQIKHAVTFPEAPHGVSEGLLGHVIREMEFEGHNALTFGASAQEDIIAEHNLGGWKIRMLGKAYRKIVSRYGLANRGQFRSKFGTEDEPLHIAYPQHGFGWAGLVALMKLMRV
ncbi:hypothetical protein Rhopal_002249-T1 [Rhodotorula paludigena]|uniref:Phosphatidylglycerol lysyltransferase C-terminal domain-containing protein n=1 Tax=Rhodotorula paludigena TaxID=86838 RepID=A0AAV5G9Q6_9BASI|nr:hypothetical protein Rhopal_002249-T1 [Rhodotorula paludigena]